MRRLAWIAVGLAIALATGLSLHRVLGSASGRVIVHDAAAPWVMPVEPFSAKNRQWGREQAPSVRFERAWAQPAVPSRAPLRVRVFGDFTVRVNDEPIPFDVEPDRRFQTFAERDVAHALRPGGNRIVVEVRNRRGPALVSLALDAGDAGMITTDRGFTARIGRLPDDPAARADDVRSHPALRWLPTPARAIRAHGLAIAVALALGAAAAWGLGLRRGVAQRRAVALGLGLTGVFWLLLLVLRFAPMPLAVGFDARGHLELIEQIASGRVPLATDGWSTYHPPLYHAIVAAIGPIGDLLGERLAVGVRRLPAWLAGLGLVLLAGRLARTLYPGRVALQAAAIGFAALLPVNLYVSAAISNEGLHAFLAGGAVVWGAALLRARAVRAVEIAAVSCWLGLALLTKYTALVAVAVVGAFCLLRLVVAPGRPAKARARDAALLTAPAVALAGWFYLRNWLVFGRPLVPNWDLPGAGRTWWSPPGFHTVDYYTSFGRSLSEPFYAGFVSFADGVYSTLWGDGLLSGSPGLRTLAVPWNLEWMAVIYWAAVPIGVIVAIGVVAWMRDAWRAAEAPESLALLMPITYAAAIGFAIFYATLSLPFFGQARAPYGLSAAPVMAVAFGRGLVALDGRARGRHGWAIRGAVGAACGLYALAVVMAFLG